MDDPWVMYYVVRKDVPLSLARAMPLAGAAAVRCAASFRATERWGPAFEAWAERPRKVALRAGEDEFRELRGLDGVSIEETILCLPPRRRSESEPALQALRPYTDGPRPRDDEPPEPAGPVLTYVIRPGVMKTTGKAIAQAGHAATMAVDELGGRRPEAFAAWHAAGETGIVRTTDDGGWERLKSETAHVVVRDGGHTQVEPGTETVMALPPLSDLPPFLDSPE